MKRILWLVFLAFFFTGNGKGLAQKLQLPGYYITLKGDTIRATVVPYVERKEINLAIAQHRVRILEANGKMKIFRPEEIRAYGFSTAESTFEFIANPFQEGKFEDFGSKFVQVLIYDSVCVFVLYYAEYPLIVLSRKGWDNLILDRVFFKKDIKQYLKDCPELFESFENSELKMKQVLTIVSLYNRTCAKN